MNVPHVNGTSAPARHASAHEGDPAAWELPDALVNLSVAGDALLDEADGEPAFVVAPIVEACDLVLLTGREKDAFKTWLALDLAVARILGASWLGFQVAPAPGRVLFVSAETSARNIGRRLRALCAGRGIDPRKVAPRLIVVREPISLITRAKRDRVFGEAYMRAKVSAVRLPDEERRRDLSTHASNIADHERDALGRNLGALDEIEQAPDDAFSLIVFDTLRQCLEGDENSSADAREAMQAARELARAVGCPVVVVHHTNKSGDASDARSARGSVEITAAPDVLLSLDTSGAHPTAHFKLRNHEAPMPRGYALAVDEHGATRIEVRDACSGGGKGDITADDVLAVFQAHPEAGLTPTTVRKLVAQARGGSKGAKAKATTIDKHLAALATRGAISRCRIDTGSRSFDGFRLGAIGGTVPAAKIAAEELDGSGFRFPTRYRRATE